MNNTLETILKHPIAVTIIACGILGGVTQVIDAINGNKRKEQ